jgi:hypothetical protein
MDPQRLVDHHVQVGEVLDGGVVQGRPTGGFVGGVNLALKSILGNSISGTFLNNTFEKPNWNKNCSIKFICLIRTQFLLYLVAQKAVETNIYVGTYLFVIDIFKVLSLYF